MRTIVCCCLFAFLANDVLADSIEARVEDKRVRLSMRVREDEYAGWQEDDMERYARAEKNLEILLEQRPFSKPEILAWQGGTKIYRAILATEAGNNEEFEKYFQEARDLFAQARKAGPKHPAVAAIVGGSYVLFADRLPEKYRDDAHAECYDCYTILWDQQSRALERLPLHIKGELLAGLAQSAQRTGRDKELGEYLDKIIEVMPDSHYAEIAEEWKTDPVAAAKGNISCNYCHDEGRLSSRMAKLESN